MSDKKPAAPAKNPTHEVLRAIGIPAGAGRWVVPGVIGLAILGGTGWGLWSFIEPHLTSGPHYTLNPQDISLTQLPAWIKTDLRGEALRNAGLDGPLSILDPQLAERLYKAFEMHPWVAKVERVTKLSPNRVEVALVYRKPVCMVEVPGGLFPVDERGVLLPSSDFSPIEAQRYPRLSDIQTVTEGPVGTEWRDPHVPGAARLAAVLLDAWTELQLDRIAPAAAAGSPSSLGEPEFELFTKGGSRIVWGRAPGSTASNEPPPADKLARLRRYAKEQGSLDGPKGPQQLDLRHGGELTPAPRTASKPAK